MSGGSSDANAPRTIVEADGGRMPYVGASLDAYADLPNILERGLSANPDAIALFSGETRWTWREFEEASTRLAHNLLGLGLTPGDRIASLMPNDAALLIHYLACFKAGLVVVPLNYRYTPPEIDYGLKVSGAVALLAHAERSEDVAASKQAGELPRGVIAFSGPIGDSLSFETLLQDAPSPTELPAPDRDAPAFIFFTSGSTGRPKGVTHSFSSFGTLAASFAQAMALTVKDVVLPGASMSHVGALSTALAALFAAAPVVVTRRHDGDELLSLFRESRPTVLVMLPATLIALFREHGATKADFASLRLCISGGDKFPISLEEEFTALSGLSINEIYGLTEAPGCLFSLPGEPVKTGSVGVVCPGYQVALRDENGVEVPVDMDGRVWIAGAAVTTGYWGNAAATKDALRDGWLDTGDIMQADSDGYFWFRGRSKQIIIHDGSNISPQEVEEAVMAHPAVENAGVVGVNDTVHGENVWAYVSWKDGVTPPSSQDVIRTARARIGYKAPEVIIALDHMPLTPVGKVDRTALKKMAADRLSGTLLRPS